MIVVDGGSDNWCRVFFCFIVVLIEKYQHADEIILARLPVGHTHFLHIDGLFGDFAQALQGTSRTPQSKSDMGAWNPQQFKSKLRSAWISSKRVVKERVLVERLPTALDFTTFFKDKWDPEFKYFGSPQQTTIEKNSEIASALGIDNLTVNRPPHVIRFSRQVRDNKCQIALHYKIHFISKEWMQKCGDGVVLIQDLSSIRGGHAPQTAKMSLDVDEALASIDKTTKLVSTLCGMVKGQSVIPDGTLQEWKSHRDEIEGTYTASSPLRLQYVFPQLVRYQRRGGAGACQQRYQAFSIPL